MPANLDPVLVLLGGGVESTSLVKRFLAEGRPVSPVHIHCGLIWDDCERAHVRRFCEANAGPKLSPLAEIRLPLDGFLSGHWAITGINVPRAGAPSADLEIPLRNLTLLGFALHVARGRLNGAHCSVGWNLPGTNARPQGHRPPRDELAHSIELALGTTKDNNYSDGSRDYFDKCEQVLSLEAGRPVRVITPLIGQSKPDVIRGSDRQTLAHSFSCVDPQRDLHCGRCIKCGRRQAAFLAAGVDDPTQYAS